MIYYYTYTQVYYNIRTRHNPINRLHTQIGLIFFFFLSKSYRYGNIYYCNTIPTCTTTTTTDPINGNIVAVYDVWYI